MADFTTSPPVAITLSVASFLRMFGQGGKDTTSLFVGTEEAAHTFTAPFAGVLIPTQTPIHSLTKATVGAVVDIGATSWKNLGVIPKGTVITIKADPANIDFPIGTIADFLAAPEIMELSVSSVTSSAPSQIALTSTSFTTQTPDDRYVGATPQKSILYDSPEGSAAILTESGDFLAYDE